MKSPAQLYIRPWLSPICLCAAALFSSCSLGLRHGSYMQELYASHSVLIKIALPVCVCMLICGLYLCYRKDQKHRFMRIMVALCSLIIGALLGCSLGTLSYTQTLKAHDSLSTQKIEHIQGFLLEDMKRTKYGSQLVIQITKPVTTKLKLQIKPDHELLLAGNMLEFSGSVTSPKQEEISLKNLKDGIAGIVRVDSYTVLPEQGLIGALHDMRRKLLNHLTGNENPEHALIEAITLGYRGNLSNTELEHNARVCGLSHILAVSGAHLAALCAIITLLLGRLPLPKLIKSLILSSFILSYLILSGMPPSALRAAILALLAFMCPTFKRRISSLHALSLGVCVLIVFDPCIVTKLSFQLSVASCAGIIILNPLFRFWLKELPLPQLMRDALAVCCAALISTLPLTIPLFSLVSIIAPISNLVALVFFTPLICISFIYCVLALSPLSAIAPVLLIIDTFIAKLFISALNGLAGIPYAALLVHADPVLALGLGFVVCTALYVFWTKIPPQIPLGLLCLCAGAYIVQTHVLPYLQHDQFIMCDIGQGDAFILKSKGHAILIDTGDQEAKLRSNLARAGINHLDAVFISHPDLDHCECLPSMKGIVRVDRVYLSSESFIYHTQALERVKDWARIASSGNVVPLKPHSRLQFGDIQIEMLGPGTFKDKGSNKDSMCLVAKIPRGSSSRPWTLFMSGDAELTDIDTVIRDPAINHIDVYKVAHHGSQGGISKDFVQSKGIKLAFISCGLNNRYGHPHSDTLSVLNELGIPYKRSDLNSQSVCEFTDSELIVQSLK